MIYGKMYSHNPLTSTPLIVLPSVENNEVIPGAISFNNTFKSDLMFTVEECQSIVDMSTKMYSSKATVGTEREKGAGEGHYQDEIRRVDQYGLNFKQESKWIFDKIAIAVKIANLDYFNYELMGITHELQLLHYKAEDKSFYDWHTDIGMGAASTRKISVVAMLSDPSDYEGGELIINNYGAEIQANPERGAINMFPSFMLHKVMPVTKGSRWVLVSWIHGSEKFR